MSEASKEVDPENTKEAVQEPLEEPKSNLDDLEAPKRSDGLDSDEVAANAQTKKRKSKKARLKNAIGMPSADVETIAEGSTSSKHARKMLSEQAVDRLLEDNPALEGEVKDTPKQKIEEIVKKGNLSELLTGLALGGKNRKDMASYKFWQTQPVPQFDEKPAGDEGPIKTFGLDETISEPSSLVEGFNWVTMDLTDEKEIDEVYELLTGHYVEDHNSMFRFNYSASFIDWALKSPGWKKDLHVGVRATQSGKLVAFISGVPMQLRIRQNTVRCSEINFLCVHKKLRSKRLAPVLIKEIARRCNVLGVWQAIYTAGIILPKPISTCQYYHRSLNWLKLYDVGFSPLPSGTTKARQVAKYQLPAQTSTAGLRPMQLKDVSTVHELLNRYLAKFDLAPVFGVRETEHWLLSKVAKEKQVIWTYVVEDPGSQAITDFFSFYCLESSVIGNEKHQNVRAAYLFYYATESAFLDDDSDKHRLRARLNALVHDALILAKQENFDVVNSLTLLDNTLFLVDQKFGEGDGRLHYYLYNYRTAPIASGLDKHGHLDLTNRSGIGVVML